MLVNKWHTFVGSAFIQMCAGLSYCFSIYAPELKTHFELTQTQLEELGFAVNLGGYLAIFPGSMYNMFADSHKIGPRLVVWMGCVCCLVGYLGLYLCSIGWISATYWQLTLFCFVAGNSGTWFDTSSLVTNVRNFPRDRGTTVGLLKSFLGLSASVYSSIYLTFFAPSIPQFLLFLALGPPLLCLVASAVVNHVPHVEHCEVYPPKRWLSTKSRFVTLYCLVALISLYQLCSTLLSLAGPVDPTIRRVFSCGLLLLLSATALATLRTGGLRSRMADIPFVAPPLDDEEPPFTFNPGPATVVHGPTSIPSTDTLIHRKNDPLRVFPSPSPQASSLLGAGTPQEYLCLSGSDWDPGSTSTVGGSSSQGRSPMAPRNHSPRGGDWDQASGSSPRAAAAGPTQGRPPRPAHKPSPSTSVSSVAADEEGRGAEDAVLTLPLLLKNNPTTDEEEIAIEATAAELGAWEAAQTLSFWMLFGQFFMGVGAGLVYLNNLAQISASLGGAPGSHVVFVSVLSVCNAMGRLLMGLLPEQLLHSRGVPRPLFLVAASAFTVLGTLVMAFAPLKGLYAASLLAGLSFGAHWTLVPAITSDLFGLKHFAANYSVLQLAPAAGGYVLATVLAGWLYDVQARKQGSEESLCMGPQCYRPTFLVLSGLCAASFLGCVYLWWSTRQVYQRISSLMRAVEEVLHEEGDDKVPAGVGLKAKGGP